MSGLGKLTGAGASQRLDAAARDLMTQPLDSVTRLELEKFQDVLSALGVQPEGLDPPSLTAAVLAFIMPRLSDPGVLKLDRRRSVLNRILGSNTAARAGSLALMHELRSIDTLRHNTNSLVGG